MSVDVQDLQDSQSVWGKVGRVLQSAESCAQSWLDTIHGRCGKPCYYPPYQILDLLVNGASHPQLLPSRLRSHSLQACETPS